MKLRKSILVGVILLMGFGVVSADDKVKNANKLGKAIQENMTSNFICQDYLGGLGHYRAAKLAATSIFSQITGDRNKAVLTINKLEQQLKSSTASKDLKKRFDKMNLPYVDRVGVCQDMTAESHDNTQVLMAKLGLL